MIKNLWKRLILFLFKKTFPLTDPYNYVDNKAIQALAQRQALINNGNPSPYKAQQTERLIEFYDKMTYSLPSDRFYSYVKHPERVALDLTSPHEAVREYAEKYVNSSKDAETVDWKAKRRERIMMKAFITQKGTGEDNTNETTV